MYHPFSVTETLSITWNVLKRNFATIAVYSLIAAIVFIGGGFVINLILDDVVLASIGVLLFIGLISFVFLGFIKLVFQLLDKQYYDFDFKDIVPKFKVLFSYLILLVIISTLSVFLSNLVKGMNEGLLQSVLGIGVAIFFEFFFLFYFPICTCFIVDDQSGPFESVVQSFHLIKGNFLKYLLLFIIIEVLVFVGSLLIVGVIFVIPFVNILLVVAYRKLVYSHLDVDDDITENA